jgi:hypothetical protein
MSWKKLLLSKSDSESSEFSLGKEKVEILGAVGHPVGDKTGTLKTVFFHKTNLANEPRNEACQPDSHPHQTVIRIPKESIVPYEEYLAILQSPQVFILKLSTRGELVKL